MLNMFTNIQYIIARGRKSHAKLVSTLIALNIHPLFLILFISQVY